ncbi:MAG: TlpA disulfide reductase family protein [Bacteroidota bacterium]
MKNVIVIFLLLVSISTAQSVSELKIETLNNKKINVKEHYQKGVLLINFWASWCQPCKSELPHLNRIYEKYKNKGFSIIGINQDSPKSVAKVRSFVASQNIKFPIAIDPNFEIFNKFNGQVLPYNLLIDSNGEIVYRHTGYVPGDEKKLEEEIVELLNK